MRRCKTKMNLSIKQLDEIITLCISGGNIELFIGATEAFYQKGGNIEKHREILKCMANSNNKNTACVAEKMIQRIDLLGSNVILLERKTAKA